MESITDSIKDNNVREYFSQLTGGSKPTVELTAEEYEAGIGDVLDRMDTVLADARETVARQLMGDIPDAISFSYIAKKYFGKSRGWLMQKVNGNTVNGKKASFTDSERETFRAALLDLSNQLSSVARNL